MSTPLFFIALHYLSLETRKVVAAFYEREVEIGNFVLPCIFKGACVGIIRDHER